MLFSHAGSDTVKCALCNTNEQVLTLQQALNAKSHSGVSSSGTLRFPHRVRIYSRVNPECSKMHSALRAGRKTSVNWSSRGIAHKCTIKQDLSIAHFQLLFKAGFFNKGSYTKQHLMVFCVTSRPIKTIYFFIKKNNLITGLIRW